MPGTLTHSPAHIVQQMVVDSTLGTDPEDDLAWPVYYSKAPGVPDNSVTVFDTTGMYTGRTATDGERAEHHGVQLRVMSATDAIGYRKARELAVWLDSDVYQTVVTIESVVYVVHAVTRTVAEWLRHE